MWSKKSSTDGYDCIKSKNESDLRVNLYKVNYYKVFIIYEVYSCVCRCDS